VGQTAAHYLPVQSLDVGRFGDARCSPLLVRWSTVNAPNSSPEAELPRGFVAKANRQAFDGAEGVASLRRCRPLRFDLCAAPGSSTLSQLATLNTGAGDVVNRWLGDPGDGGDLGHRHTGPLAMTPKTAALF
jgi:hypothetical protein